MVRKSWRYVPGLYVDDNADHEHLRCHLHLTNCIHLKHRMMLKSGSLHDIGSDSTFSLGKELASLRRSHSLHDHVSSQDSPLDDREANGVTNTSLLAVGGQSGTSLNFGSVTKDHNDHAEKAISRAGLSNEKPNGITDCMISEMHEESCDMPRPSSNQDATNLDFDFTQQRVKDLTVQRKKKIKRKGVPTPCNVLSNQNHTMQQNALCHSMAVQEHLDAITADKLSISSQLLDKCGFHWSRNNKNKVSANRMYRDGRISLSIAGRNLQCTSANPTFGKAFTGYQNFLGGIKAATFSNALDSVCNTQKGHLPMLMSTSVLNVSNLNQQAHEEENGNGILPAFNSERQWAHDVRALSPSDSVHQTISERCMPKFFHDIVGQQFITQALLNAVFQDKVSSIYIFHGPRGTGKTTCAKIFAMALNCISSLKDRPCYACCVCVAQSINGIVKEVNAAEIYESKDIKRLFDDFTWSPSSTRYKVCIVNDCHMLSAHAWNTFLKLVDTCSKMIVFILSANSIEQLPRAMILRCQKFLFSKIKEGEVVKRLEWVASQEGLEVETDALQLIALACDGSLGDAEMILDQLSLLGGKIASSAVQELVGLIPEDNLVELLDFSLSADTVNTVRSLRTLVESGAEPLNLMSQLACLITKILAGGYQPSKRTLKLQFFREEELSREDMERLRQALKMLFEAEKQLRGATDRTTWLTAALLQLAPDNFYITRCTGSTNIIQNSECGTVSQRYEQPKTRGMCLNLAWDSKGSQSPCLEGKIKGPCTSSFLDSKGDHLPFLRKSSTVRESEYHDASCGSAIHSAYGQTSGLLLRGSNEVNLGDVWQGLLDAVHSNSLREFLRAQGKLVSISMHKGSAIASLEFHQPEHISRAERSRSSIVHAFQAAMGCWIEVNVHFSLSRWNIPCIAAVMSSTTPSPPPHKHTGTSKSMVANWDDEHDVSDASLSWSCKPLIFETRRDIWTNNQIREINRGGLNHQEELSYLGSSGCGLSSCPVMSNGDPQKMEMPCIDRHAVDQVSARKGEHDIVIEPASGGILCWKSTSRGSEAACDGVCLAHAIVNKPDGTLPDQLKQLYPCPRRRRFFSNLFPCIKYFSRS